MSTTPQAITGSLTINGSKYDVAITPHIDPPPPAPAPVPPPPQAPAIPSDAIVVDMLPKLWQMNHDSGTPGTSTGTTAYPVTAPDGTPGCRQFQFIATGHGGEIWHAHALDSIPAGINTVCYELEEWMDAPSIANVAQFERDSEEVDADGTVHDMAMQVSNGVIEITGNRVWQTTGIAVPERKAGQWLRTRRFTRANGDGTVTYLGYEQDGVYYPINKTLPQVGANKWGAGIWNVQYQMNARLDNISVSVYVRKFDLLFWKS